MSVIRFEELYRGTLRGILKEEQYTELAERVAKDKKNWYGVSFDEEDLDATEMSAEEVGLKMRSLHEEILQKNYVSTRYPYTYYTAGENLSLIKLYHPGQCGGSCSTTAPDPWWVFTSVKPAGEELENLRPKPAPGFFARFKR